MARCKRCAAGVVHDFKHGTNNGYTYHRCRCEGCVSAKSTFDREYNAKYLKRPHVRERRAQYEAGYKRPPRLQSRAEYMAEYRASSAGQARAVVNRKHKAERFGDRTGRYTDAEHAVVMRVDISPKEKAAMLGRSIGSVHQAMHKLRQAGAMK